MSTEPLNVMIVAVTKTVRLKVTGDLNVDNGVHLRRVLARVPAEADVVLDVSGVRHIDSIGLWILITEASRHTNRGSSLRLENPSMQVRILLERSGTTELLEPAPPMPLNAAARGRRA